MATRQLLDYRIQGISETGKPIHGIIQAKNFTDAKKKAKTLASTRKVKLVSVVPRKTFIYRARKGDRIIDGEQAAFQKGDVRSALQKVGFNVVYVRRKWFGFGLAFGVPANEIVSFLGVSAKLLEEKLPLNEVLQVLTTNIKHEGLKNALKDINKDLKEGIDSRTAFVRQERAFGKNVALILGIASKSNDIPTIFRSVSTFVEREAEFKKGLRSSLILPGVTMVALVGALVFYVAYILPEMSKVFAMAGGKIPPLTRTTLEVNQFLHDNVFFIVGASVMLLAGFYKFIRSDKGKEMYDKWIVRIPYMGKILHNTSIELFCRVLGIMYSSSGENIDAISIAAEASRNKHIEKQIKTVAIPQMLQFGVELPVALEATKVFPEIALSRFRAGAETGGVRSAAIQLADFYELENKYALKNFIDIIQLAISFVIMVAMVFLTFLSSETANVSVKRYF